MASVVVRAEEDTVYLALAVSLLKPPGEVSSVFSLLKHSMYLVYSQHNMSLYILVEEQLISLADSKAMDFMVVDPPYNICRSRLSKNSDHNILTAHDGKAMESFLCDTLKLCSYVHISCGDL